MSDLASGSVCSPLAERKRRSGKRDSCFDKTALKALGRSWNQTHPGNQILGLAHKSAAELWQALNERMTTLCHGPDREACWANELDKGKTPDVEKALRPLKPQAWYSETHKWLTNYDLVEVMEQYEQVPELKFRFLGVFPIDFESKNVFGSCLYEEICKLQITKMFKRSGKRRVSYLGMIINLDRHDQGGSHWTALFMVVDPSLPSFGAYYYDSALSKRPEQIDEFMDRMQAQAQAAYPDRPFRVDFMRKRHQYGYSECGMFCLAYLIRWLERLRDNRDTTFDEIASVRVTDEEVHQLRDKLYRPNTQAVAVVRGGGARKK